jgi:hypothetical protein
MTCIAKGMNLSVWICATEQRSISRRYCGVIVGFDDENSSRPCLQVIRRKSRLACEIK